MSDFLQASKNPLGNKKERIKQIKSHLGLDHFLFSGKTPGYCWCLVDLLSISVLKLVFNQAYPKKMLLPNL